MCRVSFYRGPEGVFKGSSGFSGCLEGFVRVSTNASMRISMRVQGHQSLRVLHGFVKFSVQDFGI